MPSARDRLSANMAALSYALDMAGNLDDAPLEVRVGSGSRAGPLERRRQDPDIASPDEMGLEFEPGKPLKNFGRMLAHSAGIPLPYNMRQSAEAAEQARIDYENQNVMFGDMADTFLEQMDENALHAADGAETRIYQQYAAQGQDAIQSFFAQDASPDQRAAAYARLTKLDDEARSVRNADSNERTKYVRQQLGSEVARERLGLQSIDMADNDRRIGAELFLAQLENVPAGTVIQPNATEQSLLRAGLGASIARVNDSIAAAMKAGGDAAGLMRGGPGVAADVVLNVAGGMLNNAANILNRDDVVKTILEMNDAADRITEEFRPQKVEHYNRIADEAEPYGIPRSAAVDKVTISTPYLDAARGRLFPEGGSGTPQSQNVTPAPTADLTQDGSIVQSIANEDRRIKERARELLDSGALPGQVRRPTR